MGKTPFFILLFYCKFLLYQCYVNHKLAYVAQRHGGYKVFFIVALGVGKLISLEYI